MPSVPGQWTIEFLSKFKKLFTNPALAAIREGLTFSLPVIIAGTLAILINSFPLEAYQHFMAGIFGGHWHLFGSYIWNGTFGFMSIIMAISIAGSLAEHYNTVNPAQRVNPSIVSLVAVAALLCTMEPGTLFTGVGDIRGASVAFPSIWLGVHGLFWATVCSLLASYLFHLFLKFKTLRVTFYSYTGDTTMSQVMDTMVPGLLTIMVFAAIKTVAFSLGVNDINAFIYHLTYMPFSGMGGDMLGTATAYGLMRNVLWFFGVHGSNVLEPVMTELYVPGLAINQAAAVTGGHMVQIFTKPFFDCYTSLGGSGSTGGLLIACLLKYRVSGARQMAKISIFPALFNINEILLFGLPVVLNPVFLIPFILVPVVLTVVAYLAHIMGLVPPTVNDVAWNVPILLSGFLATGSWAGALLQLVCLALATLIYMPFVSLDNWLKTAQFDQNFKKLIKLTSTGDACASGPRFISSPDSVGSLARFLAQDMERGLENNEFFLVYQPQVDSNTGLAYGVEALVRWRHPEIGLVPTPVFIGLAEDSGFIDKLGLWIFDQAISQAGQWRKAAGAEKILVSINTSSKQLSDPSLPDQVKGLMLKYDVPVENIKIELTESSAIGGQVERKVLDKFSELDLKLAIDDFGMGHTSLNYIKEFKVSSLKLDSSLSQDVLISHSTQEIIITISELCRSLNIELVAEFVEDEAHLLKLRELGCYNIQGYFYSPPLNPTDCLKFILTSHQAFGG